MIIVGFKLTLSQTPTIADGLLFVFMDSSFNNH